MPPSSTRAVEREARLAEIARLDRMGYSVYAIAAAVNLATGTVYANLEEIKARYIKEAVRDREALVCRKLAEYRDLRLACWEAYERSKADAEREVTTDALLVKRPDEDETEKEEEVTGKSSNKDRRRGKKPFKQKPLVKNNTEMVRLKSVKTRTGRLPGVEYLRLIADTYKAERELLGLDEAIKLDARVSVINWDVFHVGIPQGDVIEQRIQDELDRTPRELIDSSSTNGDSGLDNGEG